jgi:hypothetical protein
VRCDIQNSHRGLRADQNSCIIPGVIPKRFLSSIPRRWDEYAVKPLIKHGEVSSPSLFMVLMAQDMPDVGNGMEM